MSSLVARSAFRAAPRLRASPGPRRWASTAADGERDAGKQALKTGAKRDPELYVCRSVRAVSTELIGLSGAPGNHEWCLWPRRMALL